MGRVDVVTLTEAMVRIDTAPGHSTVPLVDLLASELSALGAHARVQEGQHDGQVQHNLVARLGGDGPTGLILAGHIDTVPWQAGNKATIAPQRDGRTLYGRGTCDMKGAIAAQVEAAARCAGKLRRPLLLLCTYAEEVGCHGAARLVADASLLGPLDDTVCIVGEPTGLLPIIEHKGYGIARIRLVGVPAHSSNPWAGADASVALATLLRDLHELRQSLHDHADRSSPHKPPCSTLNTGLVTAGTARNVVPDRAELVLEYRPLPGDETGELRRRIQACLDMACASAPGVKAEVDWLEERPAFRQPPNTALVDWLTECTGHPPDVVAFYTEAELYRGSLGVPTVVCGPGSIDKAHRVDESITFDELGQGVELYTQAIEHFCC